MSTPLSIADGLYDSYINMQYSQAGLLTSGQVDRPYFVYGLDTTQPPNLIQSLADNYVRSQVPLLTAHPNYPTCLARGYKVQSLSAVDSVKCVVSYLYNEIPISSTVWQVETDSYPEMIDSDQQWDSSGIFTPDHLVPIAIDNYYLNVWSPVTALTLTALEPEPTAYALISVLKPRKRWSYTRTIYSSTSAKALDAAGDTYIGAINSAPFVTQSGGTKPIGTVLCYDVSVTYQPFQSTNLASLVFLYRPDLWQPFVRYTSDRFPAPPNIWRDGAGGAGTVANGTIQARGYPTADLNALVAMVTP